MNSPASAPNKVTYISLSRRRPGSQRRLRRRHCARRAAELGRTWPLHVAGETRHRRCANREPQPRRHARRRGARRHRAPPSDVADAVAAAKAAFPAWRATPWKERAQHRRARRRDRSASADSSWRLADLGDGQEPRRGAGRDRGDRRPVRLLRRADARRTTATCARWASSFPTDRNTSVLRPYGVWAVIAPWNFPYALLGAPIAAALVTGNTVVCKPSSETPLSAVQLAEIFEEAGAPRRDHLPHRAADASSATACAPTPTSTASPSLDPSTLASGSSASGSPTSFPSRASSRWAARTRPS